MKNGRFFSFFIANTKVQHALNFIWLIDDIFGWICGENCNLPYVMS
ncbi:hypothetical protein [Moraxella lacunata]